ncbi:type III PLP-dependent enzyme [Salinispora tropica]|uniref:Diaminopimelate decarboxylase n=1 Tax=Salinispora tropica (strain ATCC BAA-916 / DSM 44818 / JCM 13857 / NBRC 105044 / CNB-440) TaxID=369723 RepID=A4X2Q8_SALTO|nr:type III PLP-dependent enzyme [Salinispora tropica]ABP53158.1 diaminopimelate decarboxylase [Salinispora tropica CNB-440]
MSELAELFNRPDAPQTPAYFYDLDELTRSNAALRAALPRPTELFYSLKANPHPTVVAELTAAGCRAEVCSPGELRVALAAGCDPAQVLYTGPGKRDIDLAEAVRAGVELFSVDSPYGLDQLDRMAREHDVEVRALVRINDDTPAPGQGLTMTGVASQFGADVRWVLDQPDLFGPRRNVCPVGFHLYMGSNVDGEDALIAQFTQSVDTIRRLVAATGRQPELIDLGGGFGAPFARAGARPDLPKLADRLAALLADAFPGWPEQGPAVAFESGRYLVGTCGTLVTRVLEVKRSQGIPVVVLESGIHHLGGMSGLRRLPPIVPDLLTVDAAAGPPIPGTIVTGPLCTPLDTWARATALPPLVPGQLVAVPNVGAYGLYASLVAFLAHPMPIEVTIAGGQVTSVTRLELTRHTVTGSDRG